MNLTINEIQSGLKNYKPIEKRWEAVIVGGYEVINDSYNANPESMRAFIDTILGLYKGKTLIILGDMGELGENEATYHKEIGEYLNMHKNLTQGLIVFTIGNLSKNISDNINCCKTKHFETVESLVDYIQKSIPKDSKIFLKASRSMKLERIINLLGE